MTFPYDIFLINSFLEELIEICIEHKCYFFFFFFFFFLLNQQGLEHAPCQSYYCQLSYPKKWYLRTMAMTEIWGIEHLFKTIFHSMDTFSLFPQQPGHRSLIRVPNLWWGFNTRWNVDALSAWASLEEIDTPWPGVLLAVKTSGESASCAVCVEVSLAQYLV